jgi:PAS domain S-box-containing protein
METGKKYKDMFELLRAKALALLPEKRPEAPPGADDEARRYLHDLQVHQIELELQNEELRATQRALENSRDRYQTLFHLAPLGYVVADAAGMIRQANHTLAELLAVDAAALHDSPLGDRVHPADRDLFFARFKAFYKEPGAKQIELRMVRGDGGTIHARLQGRRIDPTGPVAAQNQRSGHLLIAISDITQAKTAEQAILRAKAQWEQTFDAVPDLIAIIDPEDNVVRVNQALARRLGVSPRECVGRKCFELLHVEGSPPERHGHRRSTPTGRPDAMEIFSRTLNGHFIASVSPFKADDGRTEWKILVFHDITDRIGMEQARLKARNLESIGTLAGGMAHDFNNILTALVGQIDLAKMAAWAPTKANWHLDRAIEAAFRARDLANRLLTFSEGGAPRMVSTRIDRLIKEAAQDHPSGAEPIRLEMSPGLPPLVVDRMQMRLAVQNIIANAREAMPPDGLLRIVARSIDHTAPVGDPPPGRYLRIDFTDQGCGIAAEHLDKIFDPYFSSKQMGPQKGTGLGLTITHSIVRRHHGHITVQSAPGQGTTVTLYLPLPVAAVQTGRALRPAASAPSANGRRLLVMDDEESIWEVIEPIVRDMGCEAEFAAAGETALALYRHALYAGQPYGAVILDLTIPGGMGGKDVIRKILEIDPRAKAAVLSGYSTDPVFTEYRRFGFAAALKKPFHIDEFQALVARLLSPGNPSDPSAMDDSGGIGPKASE